MHPTRCGARLTRIAATLTMLGLLAPAFAQTPTPQVVVSASRFADSDPRLPANISIIDAEDIRNSPVRDLPGILKSRAGIEVRSLSGSQGMDAAVDLRGFGDTAGSNTLILLDGQRLNPIDQSGVSWSAIPIDGVQRIEIIRGAGTVLYGDRASGGVINIVTDKSAAPSASVTATLGSNDYRGLNAEAAGSQGNLYGRVLAHYAAGDGWRRNNRFEQSSLSGRGGVRLQADGEVFVDYALYRDEAGLPSYLATMAYHNRPRDTRTPYDKQEREGYRLRPGVALALTDTLRVEAEASLQHEDFKSQYVSFGSNGDRDTDNWSVTPRLRWQHGLGALPSETVVGLDYYVGDVDAIYSSSPAQGAKQTSRALYVQNQTRFGDWTLTLGDRQQRMTQSVYQRAYPAWYSPAMEGEQSKRRNAADAGLTYTGNGWRAYGKVGTTYRFANTDELFAYDPFTGAPMFAGALRPQHGTIREVGVSLRIDRVSARASAYRMTLVDEIGYDGNLFANVNLDPTRRQGAEVEVDWRLGDSLKARLAYAYTDATFRSGAYDGKRVPLVARNSGSAEVVWDGGAWGRYTVAANSIGDRPYSGDFANIHGQLAGYTTVDLQAAWNWKPVTLTMRLLNALDKRYAPYAGYSPFIADHYYYPADGRTLFVSARVDMK